ncbi:MAG TPA: hypothetical protein VEW94_08605 [Chloroflexia bacterium]|nr:hypothetical protein [Chloroflexia bacterium]
MLKRILPYIGIAIAAVVLTTLLQPLAHLQSFAQGQAGCRTFQETGKMVCGRFLQYWQENGGLPQQGYPISNEFQEKSDLDGKTYTVQYFERAVFEMHPENKPPYDVLLSHLGLLQFQRKYPNGEPGQTVIPVAAASSTPTSAPKPSPAPTATPPQPVPGPGGTIVWPKLEKLEPDRARPGVTVRVTGREGYLLLPGGGYDESYRTFTLYLDGRKISTIECYVNHCEGKFVVPDFASTGSHEVSVEGGSTLMLQIAASR